PGAPAPTDFAAINLGQIKAVTAPFYDRLAELYWSYNSATPATSTLDPAWAKPWTDATGDDNNHAMANLGQLKRAFALDLDSDADSDGLSNLAELLANANRGLTPEFWTSLTNPDSDDDGILDGPEATAGTSPASADSDGDGVPDREDLFPSDGRRSDYIPPKFYAVTDLSAYLPENVRGTFDAEHVALDDNHNVAFFGTSDTPGEIGKTGHVYQWQDGILTELQNFPTLDPGPAGADWRPMTGHDLSHYFVGPYGAGTGGIVQSGISVSGINASGTLAMSAFTSYSAWFFYPPPPPYPFGIPGPWNAGQGSISYRTGEWPVANIPWPAGPIPKNSDSLGLGATVAVNNAGHRLAWDMEFVPTPDPEDDPHEGTYRYRTLFAEPGATLSEIPDLSEGSLELPVYGGGSLALYGLNNHGAFLVRYFDDDPEIWDYRYKYCQGGQVEDVPDGITQMNGAHQAIGTTYGYVDGIYMTQGWFAIETSTGVWDDPFPLIDLLKWTNKPDGTRDD
ncbi:MAG: hypothetical protein ABMA01_21635, partial [Chthoniobacteraceae bacterium]